MFGLGLDASSTPLLQREFYSDSSSTQAISKSCLGASPQYPNFQGLLE